MEGEIVAAGVAFPEGPVWADGALYFTEVHGGVLSRWTPAGVDRFATTGGGPNGATLGADGALYVTQNGGMDPAARTTAGIQRVEPDGAVTMIATAVDGHVLEAPNDLAFGDDGRLYFTDPRGEGDPHQEVLPGRIFALDVASGDGELIIELGPVFPNGIGFTADGALVWTESASRRLVQMVDGRPEVIVELPPRHLPDGFCVGEDGRFYVGSTYAHCVSVVADGVVVDRYLCGDGMPTNCCFGGTALYVTESRRGTLWRFPVGVEGVPLRT